MISCLHEPLLPQLICHTWIRYVKLIIWVQCLRLSAHWQSAVILFTETEWILMLPHHMYSALSLYSMKTTESTSVHPALRISSDGRFIASFPWYRHCAYLSSAPLFCAVIIVYPILLLCFSSCTSSVHPDFLQLDSNRNFWMHLQGYKLLAPEGGRNVYYRGLVLENFAV